MGQHWTNAGRSNKKPSCGLPPSYFLSVIPSKGECHPERVSEANESRDLLRDSSTTPASRASLGMTIWKTSLGMTIGLAIFCNPASALLNTYYEPFDDRQDESTIDGVDSWAVTSGSPNSVMPMSGNTSTGSGKSLKIMGAAAAVDVSRTDDYGNLTPTWIEYVVKPGLGREPRSVPPTGIGAVCFNLDGKIMVADSGSWVETGMTFSSDKW